MTRPPISPQSLPLGSPIDRFFDFEALSEFDNAATLPSPPLSSTPTQSLSLSPSAPLSVFNAPSPENGLTAQWLDLTSNKSETAPGRESAFDAQQFAEIFSGFDPSLLFNSGERSLGQLDSWANPLPSPATSHHTLGVVDPQWFSTPTSLSPHPMEKIEENDSDAEDDEDDDDFLQPSARPPPAKKSVAPNGGVAKRTSAVVAPRDKDPDDWRPTPEEYKKMSSKEKRQLRNKISARNFRIRRKEYINTLEGHIAERDRVLDAIRDELSNSKKENIELRREVAALKKAVIEGRNTKVPVTPATPVLQEMNALPMKRISTPLPKANPYKDLPSTSPTRGFWGGPAMSGPIMPVHATLVPDLNSGDLTSTLAGKVASRAFNINPHLNGPSAAQRPAAPASTSTFETYSDAHGFTMRNMEDIRMLLWSKLAKEAGAIQAQRERDNLEVHPTLSNLAAGLRPAFFYPDLKEEQRRLVLKGDGLPTPPSTPKDVANREPTSADALFAATLASQTLVSRLSSAFWDAFSGPSSSPSASKGLDAEKVRAVLEGKAVVKVVAKEEEPTNSLIKKMCDLSLREREVNRKLSPCGADARARACASASGVFQHVQHVWREAPMLRR